MFCNRRLLLALTVLFAASLPGGLEAQSVKDRLKQKAQERVDAKTDRAADKLLDRIENAAKCVTGDDECVQQARTDGKEVVLTDESGTVLPAAQQPSGSPARTTEAAAASSTSGAAQSASAKPVVWANYDFIPGERIMFADDFRGDRVGNFPQRLEFLYGNAEIVEIGDKRYVRATSDVAFAVPLPETLPERFTIEFDLSVPWWGMAVHGAAEPSSTTALDPSLIMTSFVFVSGTEAGLKHAEAKNAALVDPRSTLKLGDEQIAGQVHRIRVHADGKYMKVYLDEHRIANVPNAKFGRTNKLIFETSGFPEGEDPNGTNIPTLIGNISVNAGGRDMYDALMADGRVVTQGIFFDVGSDRIRPESTPTMKIIGDMLKSHPTLKLAVEGHTDNTGNAASNQTLSQKRAQAIVAYLGSQFGIDAARLQATGFGASKPAKSNDTSEGRQQNRRVELVKI